MKRGEPYEIEKNSDYFDSDEGDRLQIDKVRKTYETCEIANYQTPEAQKLQTVIIKTYLFDRNLTKLQDWPSVIKLRPKAMNFLHLNLGQIILVLKKQAL